MTTKVISIRLSDEEHKQLIIEAAAARQTKSEYVKLCVLDRDAEKIQQRAEESTKLLNSQTDSIESLTGAVKRLHSLIKTDNTHETLRIALYGVLALGVVNLIGLALIVATALL